MGYQKEMISLLSYTHHHHYHLLKRHHVDKVMWFDDKWFYIHLDLERVLLSLSEQNIYDILRYLLSPPPNSRILNIYRYMYKSLIAEYPTNMPWVTKTPQNISRLELSKAAYSERRLKRNKDMTKSSCAEKTCIAESMQCIDVLILGFTLIYQERERQVHYALLN